MTRAIVKLLVFGILAAEGFQILAFVGRLVAAVLGGA